jgi:arginyl-tRNA---protein transferase
MKTREEYIDLIFNHVIEKKKESKNYELDIYDEEENMDETEKKNNEYVKKISELQKIEKNLGIYDSYLHSSLYQHLSYPLITNINQIKHVQEKLESKSKTKEFCISPTFHPDFIDEVCYNGYFPMAISAWKYPIMAIKCHANRCIINLNEFKINKSTIKKSKNFYITMNQDFDKVIQLCILEHGESWLYPQLVSSFRYIFYNSTKFRVNILTFELYDENDSIVAVELGYLVGSVYTSLTGAKFIDSSGTIQLATLCKFFEKNGIAFWDMGMSMDVN